MRTTEAKIIVPWAAAALLAAACSGEPETVRSDKARELNPQVEQADFDRQMRANSNFGLEVLRQIDDQEKNVIFSPHSITSALAMLYAGARGGTAVEMATALRYELPSEKLHPALNKLDLALEARNETVDDGDEFRLRTANDLWLRKDYPLVPEYLDAIAVNYGAGVRVLEFQKDPNSAREVINQWVEEQTEGRIKDLLPEDSVRTETRLVLTNTVYFKAKWHEEFDPQLTSNEPFTNIDGSSASVPMMRNVGSYSFSMGADYDAVQLPYKGEELALLIVVPKSGAMAEQQAALDAEKLRGIVDGLDRGRVDLSMPKVEYEQEIDMKPVLSAMGMPNAFIAADFSGLNATESLAIDAVRHKAFVLIDEEGTEAAAATGVTVGPTSAPADPVRMIVDRPYFFFLRDIKTHAVLFMGRIQELGTPSAAN